MESLYDYYKELENDRLSFIFNGDVNDDITEGIIRIAEHNVKSVEAVANLSNRISFIMLECFQNVVCEGVKLERDNASGFFATRVVGETNYVSSINVIDIAEVKRLSEKLKQLSTLEKDKLKALYLEVLNNESLSVKGGAGYGLIQLARKAGQPISFDFDNLNEELSNFYLSLKLSHNSDQPEQVEALGFTKDFNIRIKNSDILMIYKGDFGKDSIMSIIQIIEEKLKAENSLSGSKAFFMILVELLQNVFRHNINEQNRDGIFMVTEDKHRNYWISIGNVVDTGSMILLENRINELNGMESVELKQAYKKTLREGAFSDKGGAGLGLIEIARKSSDKLKCSFESLGGDRYFFTFNVKF